MERIMKIIFALLATTLLLTSSVFAHSGRTDSNGGHNCSDASKRKGLCSGYHYHNSGSLHFDSTDEIVSLSNSSEIDMNLYVHRHPEVHHDTIETTHSDEPSQNLVSEDNS